MSVLVAGLLVLVTELFVLVAGNQSQAVEEQHPVIRRMKYMVSKMSSRLTGGRYQDVLEGIGAVLTRSGPSAGCKYT